MKKKSNNPHHQYWAFGIQTPNFWYLVFSCPSSVHNDLTALWIKAQ